MSKKNKHYPEKKTHNININKDYEEYLSEKNMDKKLLLSKLNNDDLENFEYFGLWLCDNLDTVKVKNFMSSDKCIQWFTSKNGIDFIFGSPEGNKILYNINVNILLKIISLSDEFKTKFEELLDSNFFDETIEWLYSENGLIFLDSEYGKNFLLCSQVGEIFIKNEVEESLKYTDYGDIKYNNFYINKIIPFKYKTQYKDSDSDNSVYTNYDYDDDYKSDSFWKKALSNLYRSKYYLEEHNIKDNDIIVLEIEKNQEHNQEHDQELNQEKKYKIYDVEDEKYGRDFKIFTDEHKEQRKKRHKKYTDKHHKKYTDKQYKKYMEDKKMIIGGGDENFFWIETNSGFDFFDYLINSDKIDSCKKNNQQNKQYLNFYKFLLTASGHDWLTHHYTKYKNSKFFYPLKITEKRYRYTPNIEDCYKILNKLPNWFLTNDGISYILNSDFTYKFSFFVENPKIFTKEFLYNWLKTNEGIKSINMDNAYVWLSSRDGLNWLVNTKEGQKYLDTDYAIEFINNESIFPKTTYFANYWVVKHIEWLNTRNGLVWLQSFKNGIEWLNSIKGRKFIDTLPYFTSTEYFWPWINKNINWLDTKIGQIWLDTPDYGHNWLSTGDGKRWLNTKKGAEWLEKFPKWLDTDIAFEWFGKYEDGKMWFNTLGGQRWLKTYPKWLDTNTAYQWLDSEAGKRWLGKDGTEWLDSKRGYEFLNSYEAQHWLNYSSHSKKWLETPNGPGWKWLDSNPIPSWLSLYSRWGYKNGKGMYILEGPAIRWLESDAGQNWIETNPKWLQSEYGNLWLEDTKKSLKTRYWKKWLETTEEGNKFIMSEDGIKWLTTIGLETEHGQKIIESDKGREILLTSHIGKRWIMSPEGKIWLGSDSGFRSKYFEYYVTTQEGLRFISTPPGSKFIESEKGKKIFIINNNHISNANNVLKLLPLL
jgi:hypothetical protein